MNLVNIPHGAATVLLVAVAVIAVSVLLIVATRRTSTRRRAPVHAIPVLTLAERAFHERLEGAVRRIGGLRLFSQVSMAAIIETDRGIDERTRFATRAAFNRKIVDFVVTDHATRPLLIVELDDRTHDGHAARERDANRDAITAAAGIPTLRLRGAPSRDAGHVEREMRSMIRLS